MSFRGPQALTDSLTEMFRSLRKECSGPGFQKTLQPPEFPHNPNRYLHNPAQVFLGILRLRCRGVDGPAVEQLAFRGPDFCRYFHRLDHHAAGRPGCYALTSSRCPLHPNTRKSCTRMRTRTEPHGPANLHSLSLGFASWKSLSRVQMDR